MRLVNKKLFYAIAGLSAVIYFTSCRNKLNTIQKGENVTLKSEPASESTAQPDMHNAQNSLDVAGTYKGTLPCADCKGIQTTITLNDDHTYMMTQKYLGKDDNEFKNEGKWSFLPDGNTITLSGIKGASDKYKIGENTLTMLDLEGNVVEGSLAEKYVLKKE